MWHKDKKQILIPNKDHHKWPKLSEPTADEQVIDTYNRGMRIADKIVLDTDQLYALCFIKLNNAVTPGDYAALKTAIEGITGVQNISLVVDHHTRATLPTNTQLVAVLELNLRIESTITP